MKSFPRNLFVWVWATVLVVGGPMALAEGTYPLGLTKDGDKLGYSLGYRMGAGIKRQHLDMEIDPFLQGIRDVLTETEPLVPPQEMNALVLEYKQAKREKAARERRELEEKNLKAGQAFLAENAKKEAVVTLESGLQYKVIETGDGKTPGPKDRVKAHYRGTLIDGTEFGNSYEKEEPISFGLRGVIKGWKEALGLMKEGDKWQLFVPANLAYGQSGRPPVIGPNQTLIFEVDLVAVEEGTLKLESLGELVKEQEAKAEAGAKKEAAPEKSE